MNNVSVSISNWIPLVVICPVSKLPDFFYVKVIFDGTFLDEVYPVRKRLRKVLNFKDIHMSDLAEAVFSEFENATAVEFKFIGSRFTTTMTRN